MTTPSPTPETPGPAPRRPWGCAGWAWIIILIAVILIVWFIVTRWHYQGGRRYVPEMIRLPV